jgi:hypothetical protein
MLSNRLSVEAKMEKIKENQWIKDKEIRWLQKIVGIVKNYISKQWKKKKKHYKNSYKVKKDNCNKVKITTKE